MITVNYADLEKCFKRFIGSGGLLGIESDGDTLTIEHEHNGLLSQIDINGKGKSEGYKFTEKFKRILSLPNNGRLNMHPDEEVMNITGNNATIMSPCMEEFLLTWDHYQWEPVIGNLIDALIKISTGDEDVFIKDGKIYSFRDNYLFEYNTPLEVADMNLTKHMAMFLKKNKPNLYAVYENEIAFSGVDFKCACEQPELKVEPTDITKLNFVLHGELDTKDLKSKLKIFGDEIFFHLSKNSTLTSDVAYAGIDYKGSPIMFASSTINIKNFLKKTQGEKVSISVSSSETRPILRIQTSDVTGYFSHRRMEWR